MFVLTAILGGLGVALGAFGTHGLRDRIPNERLNSYQTGVQYHLWHVLAALMGLVLSRLGPVASLERTAAMLFLIGIGLFSGSLYVYAVTGIRKLGAITPIGGLCFLAGWVLLAIGLAR